jgi:hypothetical protein
MSAMKTPAPPGAWATPAPNTRWSSLGRASSFPVETPVASSSTLPNPQFSSLKTPAPPGAYAPTPAPPLPRRENGKLKVRFEDSQASAGHVEDSGEFLRTGKVEGRPNLFPETSSSDAAPEFDTIDTSTPPVSDRKAPLIPNSPGIRFVDAFGRESFVDENRTTENSRVNVVDAMGREIKSEVGAVDEGYSEDDDLKQEEEDDDEWQMPQTREEATSRLQQGLAELRSGFEAMDEHIK